MAGINSKGMFDNVTAEDFWADMKRPIVAGFIGADIFFGEGEMLAAGAGLFETAFDGAADTFSNWGS